MSEFRLTIRTDGAAFDPDPAPEVARILRVVAERIESGYTWDKVPLLDENGNRVGAAEFARHD